jgi:DNA-binding response OmpR family regulator
MACEVCPNCGYDLERFEPVHVGDLSISACEVRWKDHLVPLSQAERMIFTAVVRARGIPVKRLALAEVIGSEECKDPRNLVTVLLCRIRKAFQSIDPDFSGLETVRSEGLRWAA